MLFNRINKQALFLVQTPFQCLCMIEAIHHFKIKDYDVFIPKAGGCQNEQMVARLLGEQGISFKWISADSWKQNVYRWLYRRHVNYNYVFVGYYYSHIERSMAIVFLRSGGQMVFLDDGTQALEIFSSNRRKFYSNWKIAIRSFPFVLLGRIKLLRKPIFFTVYNVKSNRLQIIRNSFTSFIKENSRKPSDVFIIGANSSALDFSHHSYAQLLVSLINYLKRSFYHQDIYYCPHRRDSNNSLIIDLLQKEGIKLFSTKISVEYDFLSQNLYPRYIIGFTSNALFTLHRLYKEAKVFTVYYELKTDSANRETSLIRNRLNEYGIQTLHVFEQE